MDWSNGFSARYYISVLDRKTWRDLRQIQIVGGSIKREEGELRESADIDCVNYQETSEQLIRVWLDAKQDSDSSHIPLFTGLATSPAKSIEGRRINSTLECYSVLKMAQDILLRRGWYAFKGMNSGELIKDLLGEAIPLNFITIADDAPNLDTYIIAESGENCLSMTDKILDTINWCMSIDGYGHINIAPYNLESVATFSNDNDVLETSISLENDWYGCPNVYRAVIDDRYAVARDESDNSPYSIQNRGREVWVEDSSVSLQENETLADYAEKMLMLSQQSASTISYSRRFDPNVKIASVVTLNYPAQKIVGRCIITSQTIELGYNARTSEEASLI